MAYLPCRALVNSTTLIARNVPRIVLSSKRYGSEVDTRRYKEPKFDQKVLMAVCEPIYPTDRRPSWERCTYSDKTTEKEPHPYEVIVGKELKEKLLGARFIAFYHFAPTGYMEWRARHNPLYYKGFKLVQHNRLIYKLAVTGTKFETLLPMLSCTPWNAIAYSFRDDFSVKDLLVLDKKIPGLILLGGYTENRILRKDDITRLANMPSLGVMRAQLSATLNHALSSVSSTLHYHPSILSSCLEQLIQREGEKRTSSPPSTSTADSEVGEASSKQAE